MIDFIIIYWRIGFQGILYQSKTFEIMTRLWESCEKEGIVLPRGLNQTVNWVHGESDSIQ